MPNSVALVLADSFEAHPDVPWAPPVNLPAIKDIREGVRALEAKLAPVDDKTARRCLAKLIVTFESGTKLTGDETALRISVWLEACGDMPDDLWVTATDSAIAGSKWMPKPAEFRALVSRQMIERTQNLARARLLLAAAEAPAKVEPFVHDPRDVVCRTLLKWAIKQKDGPKAERLERELAALEGRAPDSAVWEGLMPEAPQRAGFAPAAASFSPTMQAATLATAAKWHEKQGRPGYAGHLRERAVALDPGLVPYGNAVPESQKPTGNPGDDNPHDAEAAPELVDDIPDSDAVPE